MWAKFRQPALDSVVGNLHKANPIRFAHISSEIYLRNSDLSRHMEITFDDKRISMFRIRRLNGKILRERTKFQVMIFPVSF